MFWRISLLLYPFAFRKFHGRAKYNQGWHLGQPKVCPKLVHKFKLEFLLSCWQNILRVEANQSVSKTRAQVQTWFLWSALLQITSCCIHLSFANSTSEQCKKCVQNSCISWSSISLHWLVQLAIANQNVSKTRANTLHICPASMAMKSVSKTRAFSHFNFPACKTVITWNVCLKLVHKFKLDLYSYSKPKCVWNSCKYTTFGKMSPNLVQLL